MSSDRRWMDWSATASNYRECSNCGAHIDRSFVRVLEPEHYQLARACPNCPDKIRRPDGRVVDRNSNDPNQEHWYD